MIGRLNLPTHDPGLSTPFREKESPVSPRTERIKSGFTFDESVSRIGANPKQ